MPLEPFVDAAEAAEFLRLSRRRVLEMARAKEIPAHPLGYGKRKTWRFRLSELADALVADKPDPTGPKQGIIDGGGPRQPNRRN